MKRKILYAAAFASLAIVLFIGWSKFMQHGSDEEVCTLNVPEKMASMTRTRFVSGEEAIQQISKMHGKDISLKEGHIAQYQGDGKEITLWVSVSPSKEEGEVLFKIMDDKMPNSQVFTNREVIRVRNKDVVKVMGMGQEHYYWVNGKYNYWVTVTGMDAIPVIEEVQIKLE